MGKEAAYPNTDPAQHEGNQHAPPSTYTVYKEVRADIYQYLHYSWKYGHLEVTPVMGYRWDDLSSKFE